MVRMKLTCVTATFNCIKAGNRERLVRCVESVAKLETEHEHLIYDGVSTDGTVTLLQELEAKTPGLKVVSEPDTGIYNALNKGVRDAKGEWFYVLGADDYLLHPRNMDMLLRVENCDEIVTPCAMYEGIRRITLERIFRSSPYGHQGTIIKTGVLRLLGGFDERYAISADFDLFAKLHKMAKCIHYRDEIFAYYDGRGVSAQNNELTVKEHCIVASRNFFSTPERIRKYWIDNGCPPIELSVPYLFHSDKALRGQAWKNFIKLLFWPFVLLRRKIRHVLKSK